MERNNNTTTFLQIAAAVAASESQVLPVSEAVSGELAIGFEENLNYVGGDDGHEGVAALCASGGESEFSAKRKRGRPRKQQQLRLPEFMVMTESSASPQKRGRGRPKGSGKWQTLAASLGGTDMDSAGSNFTPHTIAIQTGENIVQTIYSFSQRASESICILSASGTVSSAEIQQPGSCGGILRYEGHFEIVSLTGSNSNNGTGDVQGKIFLLSVQLANPDGSLFGGAVAGSLIAGGPTQLVIATFRQKLREQQNVRHSIEPSKRNNGAVAVRLLPTANGKLPGAEVNGLAAVSPVPAPPVDGANKVMNDLDVNRASSQPFDWNSF